MKVAVVGTGYVGLVTATCLAESGNEVVGVDKDARKIDVLHSNKLPIYEPGLLELVQRNRREGRLQFTTDLATAVKAARLVFIAVGTPQSATGEADLSAIMDLRTKYNERYEKKHGVKLGFMSVFVKAVVEALKAFPQVNARIDGNDVVYQNFYDIGVAIGTEKGLVVPVIRDADRMSFAQIEQDILDYAKKAKDGKITIEDLQGGVFTISNGGTYGSLLSTPILNPPQSGILGMHAIQQRPMAVNGQVVIRPMMYLALSYDHRLVDGKEAVTFLIRIKEGIENPTRLMLEM